MDYIILLSAVFCVASVFGDDLLPKPCPVEDTDCLNKATETFLEKTAAGLPNFDIHPLDPMVIPVLEVGGNNLKITLKNIEVRGLKNQKISNFKMDVEAKSVVLTTRANLTIDADVEFEHPETKTLIVGRYSATASPLGSAKYGYTIVEDDSGVKHFAVGPETTTCSTEVEPVETLDPALQSALKDDPKLVLLREKEPSLKSSNWICKVVEVAYVTVVHNIRAAAKLVPKSAFFTNA